jgi:hypothetical protein
MVRRQQYGRRIPDSTTPYETAIGGFEDLEPAHKQDMNDERWHSGQEKMQAVRCPPPLSQPTPIQRTVFPHSFSVSPFTIPWRPGCVSLITSTVILQNDYRPQTFTCSGDSTMKLTNSTIAATFAALLIGGLAISPASAKVHNETGRVYSGSHAGFELTSDSSYTNGRAAPESSQPILKSSAEGKTSGRQG